MCRATPGPRDAGQAGWQVQGYSWVNPSRFGVCLGCQTCYPSRSRQAVERCCLAPPGNRAGFLFSGGARQVLDKPLQALGGHNRSAPQLAGFEKAFLHQRPKLGVLDAKRLLRFAGTVNELFSQCRVLLGIRPDDSEQVSNAHKEGGGEMNKAGGKLLGSFPSIFSGLFCGFHCIAYRANRHIDTYFR